LFSGYPGPRALSFSIVWACFLFLFLDAISLPHFTRKVHGPLLPRRPLCPLSSTPRALLGYPHQPLPGNMSFFLCGFSEPDPPSSLCSRTWQAAHIPEYHQPFVLRLITSKSRPCLLGPFTVMFLLLSPHPPNFPSTSISPQSAPPEVYRQDSFHCLQDTPSKGDRHASFSCNPPPCPILADTRQKPTVLLLLLIHRTL